MFFFQLRLSLNLFMLTKKQLISLIQLITVVDLITQRANNQSTKAITALKSLDHKSIKKKKTTHTILEKFKFYSNSIQVRLERNLNYIRFGDRYFGQDTQTIFSIHNFQNDGMFIVAWAFVIFFSLYDFVLFITTKSFIFYFSDACAQACAQVCVFVRPSNWCRLCIVCWETKIPPNWTRIIINEIYPSHTHIIHV